MVTRQDVTSRAIEVQPFNLEHHLHQSTCPACGHHVSVDFFDGGNQPLATLGWPESADNARQMTRLPLDFVRCVQCGHIYNRSFRYENVPYSTHPNLMYNQSHHWCDHLAHVRDMILEHAPGNPVIVEIGCGTGHLLTALARQHARGRYIGFDPNAAIEVQTPAVNARQELFDPAIHLPELKPHLVVSRHVLEHLVNPLGFIQRLSFAAEWFQLPTMLFLEVPCIDPVFATHRTNDFYYEHNSHFTVQSFTRMLERCVSEIHLIETAYGDEVVYGLVTVGHNGTDRRQHACQSMTFHAHAQRKQQVVARQLHELLEAGERIALWGGTGKGAAFINFFSLDADRFPLVVDSDPDKIGTFVPGTGQPIQYRDILLTNPVDVILITTQWRARDIVREIEHAGINCPTILIECGDRLIDYHRDSHPYKPVP